MRSQAFRLLLLLFCSPITFVERDCPDVGVRIDFFVVGPSTAIFPVPSVINTRIDVGFQFAPHYLWPYPTLLKQLSYSGRRPRHPVTPGPESLKSKNNPSGMGW